MKIFYKYFIFIYLLIFTSLNLSALEYNTVSLDILSSSSTIFIPDKECSALLDNTTNYEITQNKDNLFTITAKGVSEASGTIIFDCKNAQYIYNITYSNNYPIRSAFANGYLKMNSFINYNLFVSRQALISQSMQYTDASRKDIFLQFIHNEQDFKKKYFSNDLQINYVGSSSLSNLENNLNGGVGLGNGVNSIGNYIYFQGLGGLNYYTLGIQQTMYNTLQNTSRIYTLNLPFPFYATIIYKINNDLSKSYFFQKVFSFSLGKFQSNHIIQAEKFISSQNTIQNPQTINSLAINSFTNYFYTPFIYQQLSTYYTCKTRQICNINNLSTSLSYQSEILKTFFAYYAIPHQLSIYIQRFFLEESDVTINSSKTLKPISTLQNSPITKTNAIETNLQFASIINLRKRNTNFLTTVTLPLLFLNQQPFAQINIQFDRGQFTSFSNLYLSPYSDTKNWLNLNWNFSIGLTYYPNYNLNTFILNSKNHKITGILSSNIETPIPNTEVILSSPNNEIFKCFTNSKGEFEFNNISSNGKFRLSTEKDSFKVDREIQKEISSTNQSEKLTLPLYSIINIHFYEIINNKEVALPQITNSLSGFSIISIDNSIYSENKIYVPRKKTEVFKVNPEILPFGFKLIKMSAPKIDTLENEDFDLNIYLKKTSDKSS